MILSLKDLERDLEVERRKVRDLQEATREREKEYQKLKVRIPVFCYRQTSARFPQIQHDKQRRNCPRHNGVDEDVNRHVASERGGESKDVWRVSGAHVQGYRQRNDRWLASPQPCTMKILAGVLHFQGLVLQETFGKSSPRIFSRDSPYAMPNLMPPPMSMPPIPSVTSRKSCIPVSFSLGPRKPFVSSS